MGFRDLSLPDALILVGERIRLNVGETFWLPLGVEDVDGSLFDWRSGYTASAVFNLEDGTNVFTVTHADGRLIFRDPAVHGSTIDFLWGSSVSKSVFGAYLRMPLVFNLSVVQVSDSWEVDVMRDCYLIPRNAND